MSNPLILSSLVFYTNLIMAQFKGEMIYSLLFGLLTISSLFFHTFQTLFTNLVDKVAILSVVCYGTYALYLKSVCCTDEDYVYIAMVVISFFSCIGLYFYGYLTQQYCYDPELGDWYHALLHFISSLGHHVILFL
jgi:hypothetical protein